MGKYGRGGSILEKNGNFNSRLAAERLRAYMKEHKLSFVEMGKSCGLDRRTISSIANAGPDTIVRESTVNCIERATGITKEYWQGITEQQTKDGYLAEVEARKERLEQEAAINKASLEFDNAILEAQKILEGEYKEQNQRYETMFDMCGYRYENAERKSWYEFNGISDACPRNEEIKGPHVLSPYREPERRVYLSDEELKNLLQQMEHTIDFTLYARERSRKK